MYFFLNICQVNVIKSCVSFFLKFSFFTFRLIFTVVKFGDGLNKFTSFITLLFEAVPINQMSPKTFFLMEEIIFFEENIITSKIIFLHVFCDLSFWHLIELFNNRERNVSNNFFEMFRNGFEIFINITTINSFLKILIHLDDLKDGESNFWIAGSDLTHKHHHVWWKVFILEHKI